jgi:hypothetical protein
MFIFVEGSSLSFDLGHDVVQERIEITYELTFIAAIKMLASRTKQKHPVVTIFTNFFSVGCHKLEPCHLRGLERIAMGDNAIEVINKEKRTTRFLLTMKGSKIREHVGTLRNIARDYVGHGIGNLSVGNTLIVGESPGPNSHGYNTPFVGTGSGLWLLRQLEDADVDESRIYWVNAYDRYGKEMSNDFMVNLQPSRIITLGNEAKKWAGPRSSSHILNNLPHPQYWLRFRSKEEYPLLKLLKQ